MDVVDQIEAHLGRATQDFDGRDEIMSRAKDEVVRLRKIIKDNWMGQYWRAVSGAHANEVNEALGAAR